MSNVFGLQKNGSNNVFALQAGPTAPATNDIATNDLADTTAVVVKVGVTGYFGVDIGGNVAAIINTLDGSDLTAMVGAITQVSTPQVPSTTGTAWTPKPRMRTTWVMR